MSRYRVVNPLRRAQTLPDAMEIISSLPAREATHGIAHVRQAFAELGGTTLTPSRFVQVGIGDTFRMTFDDHLSLGPGQREARATQPLEGIAPEDFAQLQRTASWASAHVAPFSWSPTEYCANTLLCGPQAPSIHSGWQWVRNLSSPAQIEVQDTIRALQYGIIDHTCMKQLRNGVHEQRIPELHTWKALGYLELNHDLAEYLRSRSAYREAAILTLAKGMLLNSWYSDRDSIQHAYEQGIADLNAGEVTDPTADSIRTEYMDIFGTPNISILPDTPRDITDDMIRTVSDAAGWEAALVYMGAKPATAFTTVPDEARPAIEKVGLAVHGNGHSIYDPHAIQRIAQQYTNHFVFPPMDSTEDILTYMLNTNLAGESLTGLALGYDPQAVGLRVGPADMPIMMSVYANGKDQSVQVTAARARNAHNARVIAERWLKATERASHLLGYNSPPSMYMSYQASKRHGMPFTTKQLVQLAKLSKKALGR